MALEVCFILSRPQTAENIGAAARAIKTMGFHDLRIVGSRVVDEKPASWMACHAKDVLENAQRFSSLHWAREDIDLLIGTTAKNRAINHEYILPQDILTLCEKRKENTKRIGILFGSEDLGLTNEEITECDLVSSIPSNPGYGVLNLAQCVMVYAYELSKSFQHQQLPGQEVTRELCGETLRSKVSEMFKLVDIDPYAPRTQRLFEKLAQLDDEQIQLVHFLRKKILKTIMKEVPRGY